MNTEDTITRIKSRESLFIACVACAVRNKTSFHDIRKIMDWLECYDPVMRVSDREVSFEMLAYLTEGCSADLVVRSRKVFHAWLTADLVETCLTEKQQDKCVRLLRKLDAGSTA